MTTPVEVSDSLIAVGVLQQADRHAGVVVGRPEAAGMRDALLQGLPDVRPEPGQHGRVEHAGRDRDDPDLPASQVARRDQDDAVTC